MSLQTKYKFSEDLYPDYTEPIDWDELFAVSDYLAQKKVIQLYKEGKIEEFERGLEKMEFYILSNEKQDTLDELKELMELIILWKESDDYKTGEAGTEIDFKREDVIYSMEILDFAERTFFEEHWKEVYNNARNLAEGELERPIYPDTLTWEEVFEHEYDWQQNNNYEQE